MPKNDSEVVTIRVKADLLKKIDRIAKTETRTRSNQIHVLLALAIQTLEVKDGRSY